MWIVLFALAGFVSGLGLHFSIPSTVFTLAMLALFVWVYRIVSRYV